MPFHTQTTFSPGATWIERRSKKLSCTQTFCGLGGPDAAGVARTRARPRRAARPAGPRRQMTSFDFKRLPRDDGALHAGCLMDRAHVAVGPALLNERVNEPAAVLDPGALRRRPLGAFRNLTSCGVVAPPASSGPCPPTPTPPAWARRGRPGPRRAWSLAASADVSRLQLRGNDQTATARTATTAGHQQLLTSCISPIRRTDP